MERVHSLSMMSRFLLLHCLILISLFIAASTANSSSTITDRDALLALKARITHDPTNFLAKNWNTSTHASLVMSIAIDCNRLSGSIPSAIVTTYTLKHVSLGGNQLSGQIPTNICSNLPFLEFLSLSQNMFHGGIPSTLSNCTYLRILSLAYNDFSGAVPREIGNLTKLKELYLGGNRLQGAHDHGV
ncbi:hypothetical protein CUMW_259200 [Citrus unshiu]|uniref:Leucine-rich repeat-containing N-terminal plant-type domain-containing protein n=1 Tax=Citrus unshiu TaxID=55188 RepID=A0A2H5QT30_CITUN|nr:hypothetical protein CUMW_259200 [Citrus unshiu]